MKTLRTTLTCWVALLALVLTAFAPVTANAQSLGEQLRRRQEKKNEWRNIAYAGAALGVLGLLTKNNTLMLAGVAGGLYSAHRYEQDRKSHSDTRRRIAYFYSQPRVRHNGRTYVRRTVWRNGQRYYTFVRAR